MSYTLVIILVENVKSALTLTNPLYVIIKRYKICCSLAGEMHARVCVCTCVGQAFYGAVIHVFHDPQNESCALVFHTTALSQESWPLFLVMR